MVAGGIFDREDIAHALDLGANGVQIASRFVATEECDASEAYKQAILMQKRKTCRSFRARWECRTRAQEPFYPSGGAGPSAGAKCYNCLEKCNPAKVPYCITKALIDAVKGDVENGLIFCGSNVGRIREMTTVHQLIQELV